MQQQIGQWVEQRAQSAASVVLAAVAPLAEAVLLLVHAAEQLEAIELIADEVEHVAAVPLALAQPVHASDFAAFAAPAQRSGQAGRVQKPMRQQLFSRRLRQKSCASKLHCP